MTLPELFFVVLFSIGVISEFISIALMFYVGRTRIKEIDKVVYGFEFPNDSIFTLMIRVPNYASAFLWEWSARRSGLKGKIEHFDNNFRWPFVTVFFLAFFGLACMIAGIFFEKYVDIG